MAIFSALRRTVAEGGSVPRTGLVLTCLAAVVITSGEARAACNLIPSASQSFRSTLGGTDRPFAAPNDLMEVGVQPARCDQASPGFSAVAADQVVTVVFTPPGNGQRRVVFLTTDTCG